jgi:hypothetical protein
MNNLLRSPFFIFAVSFVAMWLAGRIGARLRKKRLNLESDLRQDLDLVVTANLTLLALIIGFSFSMAISRYDQRKSYEEAEANAIGTEYLRAGLLPGSDTAKVRLLLKDYLDQRIAFYLTRDDEKIRQVNAKTAQVQTQLWSAVQSLAATQSTPVMALVLSGMNDVLNSQGYTQAAWWNRIPTEAWVLMVVIAMCGNLLVSYTRHRINQGGLQFLVLPLILSIAFFLIADIDSPRRGVVRVRPQNLISLVESLPSISVSPD